jgi:hypothetical protein
MSTLWREENPSPHIAARTATTFHEVRGAICSMGKSLSVATYLPLSTLTIGDTIIGLGGAGFHHRPSPRLQRATSMSFSKNRDQTTDRRDPIQENADVDGRSSWLQAESPILISNAFGLENVHRPLSQPELVAWTSASQTVGD